MTERFDKARRTLVVGLGVTGLSVARYLSRQGVPVAIVDSREQPPGLDRLRAELPDDVALFLGGFQPEAFARAEQIVISPGVSREQPEIMRALERNVPVIGDIELFARVARAPVIAVTGSNGKSTVVTLLAAMARRAGRDVRLGGNIGTPVLDLLDGEEPDLYVLELSSFQLESVESLRPAAAAVLNISADHLDRYPDMDAYVKAKQAIYRNASVQVVNRDDPTAAALADGRGTVAGYSLGPPVGNDYGIIEKGAGRWLARDGEALLPIGEVHMAGRHNLSNALAVLALGEAVGLSLVAMLETLREFNGLPHRMQFVAERAGVRWYNDSKGTNVGATLAAIDGTDGRLVLIAGGDSKGADLTPLAAAVAGRAHAVIVLGKDAAQLAAVLHGVTRVIHATDLPQAVQLAADTAEPGDTVLLSPACASTDMFSSYVERGDVFIDAVKRLEH
ncbi:MAG: UDP-N-acetylmuramoyl-L-alanine--D-glutamate ligase [Gammaproteobacteria bacterium]